MLAIIPFQGASMRKLLLGITATLTALTAAYSAQANTPYCREFTQSVTIGGRVEHGYGTACMQPDGAWEIVKPVQAEPSAAPADYVAYEAPPPPVETVVYEEHVYAPPPRPAFELVFESGHRHGRHWKHDRHRHGRGHGHGHRHW
jgi:hypothetical protein